MLENIKKRLFKKERYLHKNIEFLLSNFSLDIKSLSAETGVPIATIFRMKKIDNNPTISSIEPIADFFRIPLNELLYEDLASDAYQNKQNIGKIHYLPIINLDDIKKWPFVLNSKTYLGTVGNLNKNSFGIKLNTSSMAPIFYKNSVLVVDREIKPMDNDYVFCLIADDKIPVLRQVFIDGDNYFFKPINPNYGEMLNAKKFKIIGIIVKSIENHR